MLQDNSLDKSNFRPLNTNELEAVSGGAPITVTGYRLTGGVVILGGGASFGTNGNETGNEPTVGIGGRPGILDESFADPAFLEKTKIGGATVTEDSEVEEQIERLLEDMLNDIGIFGQNAPYQYYRVEFDARTNFYLAESDQGDMLRFHASELAGAYRMFGG